MYLSIFLRNIQKSCVLTLANYLFYSGETSESTLNLGIFNKNFHKEVKISSWSFFIFE